MSEDVAVPIKDSELGACGKCSSYKHFGPHKRVQEKVKIACVKVKGLVEAKIEIDSPKQCDLNKKV